MFDKCAKHYLNINIDTGWSRHGVGSSSGLMAQLVAQWTFNLPVAGSNPAEVTNISRGRAEVARRAHNPKVAGSNPAHRYLNREPSAPDICFGKRIIPPSGRTHKGISVGRWDETSPPPPGIGRGELDFVEFLLWNLLFEHGEINFSGNVLQFRNR